MMPTRYLRIAFALAVAAPPASLAEIDHRYLFMGHPRDDQPGEIVQPDVERVDYSAYDLLLLGGDYTWRGTGTRDTVDYLEEIFSLSSPNTLAALGNHDTQNKSYFTDLTGRGRFYTYEKNKITFVVLDTTDNSQNISGAELTLLEDTIEELTTSTHLVIVHHHLIWLSDYAPLAHLIGSPKIGASSANLSGKNFHSTVYPLLLEAQAKGAEVICLGGDRTGTDTEEFFVDHTTTDGIRFIGAGLKEELDPALRTVVVLEHDTTAETLTPVFKHLSDLPKIPDEDVLITEIHYNPSDDQGNDHSFIEFLNTGSEPFDLSLASFSMGVTATIPNNTFLAPGEYLIVAAEPSVYEGQGYQVINYSGVSRPDDGEAIILRNARGLIIDAVEYQSSGDWPSSPDGSGPSLALIDSSTDNAPGGQWRASDQDGGTPGASNFPLPSFTRIHFVDGEAQISWDGTLTGARYQVQYSATLREPDWQPLGAPLIATESTLSVPDSGSLDTPARFYRITRSF